MSDFRRGVPTKFNYGKRDTGFIQRNARLALPFIIMGWGDHITTIGGSKYRENDQYDFHPSGNALDVMKVGGCDDQRVEEFREMAWFFVQNAREFGVRSMIFQQKYWQPQHGVKRPKDWTDMSNRGSCTNNHQDHLHIDFIGPAHNGHGPITNGAYDYRGEPDKKSRPIPPQLLKKRRPKSIEVGFKWGDDQGDKKKENDKKSDAHEQITRRTTIKRCTDEDKDKDKKIEGYCNGKYIWARLRSWGFTKEGAAGVLGNFYQESRFNPGANQSGGPGRGIAQWSEGARWDALVRWANKKDLKPNDIETQMDWVWVELNQPSYSSLKGKLRNVTNIEDAVKEFHDIYEGSADSSMSVRNRYARQWFDRFDGKPDNYFFVIKKIKNPDGSETETEVAEEPPEPEFVVSTLPSGLFSLSLLTPTQWGDVALVPDPTEADPDAEGDLDGTFTE